MNLVLESEMMPLRMDAEGTIRVGGTRVTLDSVVTAMDAGASPEETIERFPTLELADVYLVFGYCLRHRQELEERYFAPRRVEAERHRQESLKRWGHSGIRARLEARQALSKGRKTH